MFMCFFIRARDLLLWISNRYGDKQSDNALSQANQTTPAKAGAGLPNRFVVRLLKICPKCFTFHTPRYTDEV
ncbi:hypothetical protein SAMN05192562_1011255 [Kosakonia arachidis]|uniref:Uncharacterized protein n=1 Tax=Kosakonia arachidis TaxID=551989 RepID=A0A1I6ZME9_9ENTR|nr:hypothetical protein SAMN05192562_1011255 [Kosakonia arachidis]